MHFMKFYYLIYYKNNVRYCNKCKLFPNDTVKHVLNVNTSQRHSVCKWVSGTL